MEISSRFVGTPLRTLETGVSWRQTMNYAAATGDHNPCYFDDERKGGVMAPPMFAVAVTWPISEKIWDYIEAEDFPKEILMTQVHYTEHLCFHRLIRPDENLTVKGRIAAILPHKAGTLVVLRYDALDGKGNPVFTEHIGGMMRGVRCTDAGGGLNDLPKNPDATPSGQALWETVIPVDPLAPFIYDGCANIYFPIHTSLKFAHAVGLPDIILQGTATLAYAIRELTNREAGGDPALLKSLHCRFTGMIFPGSAIHLQVTGVEKRDAGSLIFFHVLNHEGKKAISDGVVLLAK